MYTYISEHYPMFLQKYCPQPGKITLFWIKIYFINKFTYIIFFKSHIQSQAALAIAFAAFF